MPWNEMIRSGNHGERKAQDEERQPEGLQKGPKVTQIVFRFLEGSTADLIGRCKNSCAAEKSPTLGPGRRSI